MSLQLVISLLSVISLAILGSIGFQSIYSGRNWVLRHFSVFVGLLSVVFIATFTAVKGYSPDKLLTDYVGRPLAEAFGFDVWIFEDKEAAPVPLEEPRLQPWIYQSEKESSTIISKLDSEHAAISLTCAKSEAFPFLSFSVYFPNFGNVHEGFMKSFMREYRAEGFVVVDVMLGTSVRISLSLSPIHTDNAGTTDGWSTLSAAETGLDSDQSVRRLVKSMIAQNSSLKIVPRFDAKALPINLDTQGFRYLEQETSAMSNCIEGN